MPTDTKLILLDTTEGGISYPGIRARLIGEQGVPFAQLPPGRPAGLPETIELDETRIRLLRGSPAADQHAAYQYNQILNLP